MKIPPLNQHQLIQVWTLKSTDLASDDKSDDEMLEESDEKITVEDSTTVEPVEIQNYQHDDTTLKINHENTAYIKTEEINDDTEELGETFSTLNKKKKKTGKMEKNSGFLVNSVIKLSKVIKVWRMTKKNVQIPLQES